MILAACVMSKEGRIYTEKTHVLARDEARMHQGESYGESDDDGKENYTDGFLSDTYDYDARNGKIFNGLFRGLVPAYIEAKECGQLLPGHEPKKVSYGGIEYGVLESEEINFSPEQLRKAKRIAGIINHKINVNP